MNTTLAVAFVSVCLGAMGQFLLKVGVTKMGGLVIRKGEILSAGIKVATQPHIVLGTFLFALGMLVWLTVLSEMELSKAYPMVSVSYVLVALMSKFFLGEQISSMRGLGIAVVLLGVVLINAT